MPDEQATVDSKVSEHCCQLFDSRESLARAVSRFLGTGFDSGDRMLAVMRPDTWASTARHLRQLGLDPDVALETGQLTVLDAITTLATFMCGGRVDREMFEHSVGDLVRAQASDHRQLRIWSMCLPRKANSWARFNSRGSGTAWARTSRSSCSVATRL